MYSLLYHKQNSAILPYCRKQYRQNYSGQLAIATNALQKKMLKEQRSSAFAASDKKLHSFILPAYKHRFMRSFYCLINLCSN